MSTIKLTLPVGESCCVGKQITFKAPSGCTNISTITVDGNIYQLVDVFGKPESSLGKLYDAGTLVTVILDTNKRKAYLQNPSLDTVFVAATVAQESADKAQLSADNAQESADKAQESADNAQQTANEARSTATTALVLAEALELQQGTNITANAFTTTFDTLEGFSVTDGTWNVAEQRIEF